MEKKSLTAVERVAALRERIVAYVKAHPSATLADLKHDVKGVRGDCTLADPATGKVYGTHLSAQACAILLGQLSTGQMEAVACDPLLFIARGSSAPELPLAFRLTSKRTPSRYRFQVLGAEWQSA